MKNIDKEKPIHTIPKGVWESSRPDKEKEQPSTATKYTDHQGNGYPQGKKKGKTAH